MNGYGRNDVLKFLEFLGDKGLMNADTVTTRRVAFNAVFGILDDAEAADVRKLNIDDVMSRFVNKKGSGFKPDSLKLYKARATKALEDFLAYKKDPLSFKPAISQRSTRSPNERSNSSVRVASNTVPTEAPSLGTPFRVHPIGETESLVFPIPIRPGVVVKVAGIPADLTAQEARRVSSVILALAASADDK